MINLRRTMFLIVSGFGLNFSKREYVLKRVSLCRRTSVSRKVRSRFDNEAGSCSSELLYSAGERRGLEKVQRLFDLDTLSALL
jgi:hypothetical protein